MGSARWDDRWLMKRELVVRSGGGYVQSAMPFHFQFLVDLREHLKTQGVDLAFLVLAYGSFVSSFPLSLDLIDTERGCDVNA